MTTFIYVNFNIVRHKEIFSSINTIDEGGNPATETAKNLAEFQMRGIFLGMISESDFE